MDHVELSKHLRNISAKSSSTFLRTICKMAAQKIDKMAAELEQTKVQLAGALEDLKKVDMDCSFCSHNQTPAPCAKDDAHYTCDVCPKDCYCKDCKNNSKWEWKGAAKVVQK